MTMTFRKGIFTTDDELGVPFERPQQFAGREVVSEKELEEDRLWIWRSVIIDSLLIVDL